eukprot:COSAG06_NODE_31671_length_517_cov_1.612440_2_plen_23_part_01
MAARDVKANCCKKEHALNDQEPA